MPPEHIIIIGAGACGLMAARELSRSKARITVLEARDRSGGRIWKLPADTYGYAAEGAAEFVHGKAPITRSLLKEAGLTYAPTEGDMWSVEDGKLTRYSGEPMDNPDIDPYKDELHERLKNLRKDMPIADFLRKYFADKKHAELRQWITRMTEGFDAADPRRASTFALRDEWLGGGELEHGRIREGYGALMEFLASQCAKNGVEILLNTEVTGIDHHPRGVKVTCKHGQTYTAQRVIVTVALPLIKSICFTPALPEKLSAAEDVGYGGVMKIILRFKDCWWMDVNKEMETMSFLFAEERIPTWWTQYPQPYPVLTGWVGGPRSDAFAAMTSQQITAKAIGILARVFNREEKFLEEQLLASTVANWPLDPFARGAYSYATPETAKARILLNKPVHSTLYFAGEALYECGEIGTVEAALGSGKEVAKKVKSSIS